MHRTRFILLIMIWLLAAPFAAQPHALNPESIDRYVEATLAPTQVVLVYQIIFGLSSTEEASQRLDPDDDGVITDEERAEYVKTEGKRYGGRQYLKIGDETLTLEFRMGDAYAHFGHNGMHVIKVDLGYVCPLPAGLPRGATLDFQLKDYDLETVPGWKQMQIVTAPGVHYEGHIPYREFKPFDYEILNEKGFAPGTDSIKGQVSFDETAPDAEVNIILPERTVVEKPKRTGWQYGIVGGAGILALAFIAAAAAKFRR
ncbi:MAG: hypothetical protein P9L94_17230 [Candidatus Hinthialibacter antarcticus]|nr:hypothetical protein [Candidatus Hinthialibacter antarcticus]